MLPFSEHMETVLRSVYKECYSAELRSSEAELGVVLQRAQEDSRTPFSVGAVVTPADPHVEGLYHRVSFSAA